MVLRLVLVAVGLLELLRPRKFVDTMMDVAVANDADIELRSWVYTVARLEGLFIVLWALKRGRKGSD